jgi:4-amino-4-deoxy-L-arabinose transferase-like glycosyltransferase
MTILSGHPNPEFFHWPSLTLYVLAASYVVAGVGKTLVGLSPALVTPEQYLVGRAVMALTGTATLIALYALARRVVGETNALIATGLLAVAVLHVRESHFAMTDVLATFLVTLSLALLVRAFDEPGPRAALRTYAAAGFVAGLAASTKYHTAAVAASMAAAQLLLLLRTPRSILRPAVWLPATLFALAMAGGFLVGTPYAVLDYQGFRLGLREIFDYSIAGNAIDLGRGWIYHLRYSLPVGMGVTAFVAALGGVFLLLVRHVRHGVILLAFVVAFYGLVGSGRNVFFRYMLPIVPVLCLAAPLFLRQCSLWLARRYQFPDRRVLATLVIIAVAPGLIASGWLDVLLARTDTRVIASRWFVQHLRAGDVVYDAGDSYGRLDVAAFRPQRREFDFKSHSFRPPSTQAPDWLVLPESPMLMYGQSHYAVREIAARDYVQVFQVQATSGRSRWAIYDEHDAFFMPMWGFWTVKRPGPTIRIYRRKGA